MALKAFLIIPAAVLQADVSAEAKLVGGAVCFLARPTGFCTSRYREIGELVGLNKRAVMRAISELTNAGLIVASGGGNGVARTFSFPVHLVQDLYHFDSATGAGKEAVGRQHRSRNGSGPLLIMNRTATESAPPYKEEKNNNNKSASEDAGTALSLPKLQQKWFEDEFWPLFWRKQDKAEALEAFKSHATSVATKDRIVAALKAQWPEMRERQVQFRPYATSWLNKRRYDDDPALADSDGGAPPPWQPPWEERKNNA